MYAEPSRVLYVSGQGSWRSGTGTKTISSKWFSREATQGSRMEKRKMKLIGDGKI